MRIAILFVMFPFFVFAQKVKKVYFYVDSVTINSLSVSPSSSLQLRFLAHNPSRYSHLESSTYYVSEYPSTIVFKKPFRLVLSDDVYFQFVKPLSFNKNKIIANFDMLRRDSLQSFPRKINLVNNENNVILHLSWL